MTELVTIQNYYHNIDQFQGIVVYQPADVLNRKPVGIVLMHSDDSYYGFVPAPELAKRGFTVFTSHVQNPEETLDQKILDLHRVVDFARAQAGIQHLVILGHSGGATLASAYQAIAENGQAIFQDDHRLIKLSDVGQLAPADGMMFLDSNFGNGVMTLLSVDPAVTDETSAQGLNPAFELDRRENGWDGHEGHYSEDFIQHYQKAQAARYNRLIDYALGRLRLIEAGQGKFADDEPFDIVGGAQYAPCNKLFPQDIRLLSHTEQAWPLIHADGSTTVEVVRSLRQPRPAEASVKQNNLATKRTTIKNFLTNLAVRTTDYSYDESHVYGIDWNSAYCNTPGNAQYIHVPALVMGNTGSYEFMAAEQVYGKLASQDKAMAFVEGASHNFVPQTDAEKTPGEFGDTVRNCFDHVAEWLEERFV